MTWLRTAIGGLWLVPCLVGGVTMTVLGQSALPPTEDIEKRQQAREEIDRDLQELARDYVDVLRQLEAVTLDYTRYLSRLSEGATQEQRRRLAQLAARLAAGAYTEDIKRLTADIESLRAELQTQEKDLRRDNVKVYKLTKSLRRELDAIEILLESEISQRLPEPAESPSETQIFFQEVGVEIAPELKRLSEHLVVLFDSQFVATVESLQPEAPTTIVIGDLLPDDVPEPPAPRPERDLIFMRPSGEADIIMEFTDSLPVLTSAMPIVVESPLGDIRVTGWDRDVVKVHSKVAVSSDSKLGAESLAKSIRLNVCPKDGGICVEISMPNIHDPHTNVDNSVLEVMTPLRNELRCIGSFGRIEVNGVENRVGITASNCGIDVRTVIGDVTVDNSMGRVSLTDVIGDIQVSNSLGPVAITDCSGQLEIENEYSSIDVSQCEGEAGVRNSGPIRMRHHTGSIAIDNSNGLVDIRHHEGDVTATSSLQPLVLEGIDGSAQAENQRGAIRATGITGSFQAHNQFAPIQAHAIHGALDLNNLHGVIDVSVTEETDGPSSIIAQDGLVKLALARDLNMNITAIVVGGDIQSAWPMTFTSEGESKTAMLTLGKALTPLTINGNNATIILSELR